MSNPFVAEIRIFPFNFAPTGWAQCNGQLLPISQNTALFSLLGTTYGGDGKSNFALPNLEGSVLVQQGQGPGLSQYILGQTGGEDTVALNGTQVPAHSHSLNATTALGTTNAPGGNDLADPKKGVGPGAHPTGNIYNTQAPNVTAMTGIQPAGGSGPHNNLQPYLTLNYCIAMQGVYPPRS